MGRLIGCGLIAVAVLLVGCRPAAKAARHVGKAASRVHRAPRAADDVSRIADRHLRNRGATRAIAADAAPRPVAIGSLDGAGDVVDAPVDHFTDVLTEVGGRVLGTVLDGVQQLTRDEVQTSFLTELAGLAKDRDDLTYDPGDGTVVLEVSGPDGVKTVSIEALELWARWLGSTRARGGKDR